MGKVVSMTMEELEDSLEGILPSGYEIKHTRHGIVIYTNLRENSYGELTSIDDFDGDEDDDSLFDDEDMESLSEDEDSDD